MLMTQLWETKMDFALMTCRGSKAEHRYCMVVYTRRSSRAFQKKK